MWRGIDLGAEWRSRRWRRLLNLIDGLPRNSAYAEAQSQDEDLARAMLSRREPERTAPQGPPMREWSPEMEMLMKIFDRLGEVIQAQLAAAGAKPPKVKPLPRPETALDRMRHQKRMAKHRSVVARVLPHKADGAAAPSRPRRPSAGVKLGRAVSPPGQAPTGAPAGH